jgi:hypothetical protein
VLVVVVATAGCRTRRGGTAVRRGDVVVLRAGAVDEPSTLLARAIDARVGRSCPGRIVLRAGQQLEPRRLAETCVRTGAHLATARRFERARPFATGLVELAAIDPAAPDAESIALRSLARLAFARGLLAVAALDPSSVSPPFQEIEEAAPMELDADTRRGVALFIVEHLLSRKDIDARAVIALADSTATLGVTAALARPPFRTDVDTLFASVRALALSFHPPRAPALSTVELLGTNELLAQFDAKLAPAPMGLLVCGERYQGVLTAAGDAFKTTFDEKPCLDVDGVRIVFIEVGGLSTSPRGLDGAIVGRTFARAESPPTLDAPPANE